MNLLGRLRSLILGVTGYLIPLVQSLPALGVWTSLMTLPFASYLILFFANFPASFLTVFEFWSHSLLIPEKIFIIIGFLLLVYTIIYLRMKGNDGLVTSGPYGIIRHPQYLGIILATLGFTSLSIWILNTTYGMGFLSPSQTIVVWFIEVLAYVVLALVEELFLSRNYGRGFSNYASQVPFLIPFLKTNRKYLDVIASILIPTTLLLVLINIQV